MKEGKASSECGHERNRETNGQRDSVDREETRGRSEASGTRGKSVRCAWPAPLRGAQVA